MASAQEPVTYADIQAARQRIASDLTVTPLLPAPELCPGVDKLLLKAESLQHTGSFKPRGALNWVRNATRDELERGLLTVSAGNHAQALAWAARAAGASLTVVMPADASPMKVAATRGYGAEVILHGDINAALEKTAELEREQGLVLVHPYDNPRIIAGQGTVGLEILDQGPAPDLILCPVGGGGLISGIAMAVKHHSPKTRVIGVEPEGAVTLRYAWDQGGPKRLPRVDTVAASLGAAEAGKLTYALSREYVDDLLTVTDAEILAALRAILTRARLYAEPGGAVAVAALLAGRIEATATSRVVAVISGGNLDIEKLASLLTDSE